MNNVKFSLVFVLLVITTLLTACGGTSANGEIKIGEQAPDFILIASDGNPVTLSEYKGQPVLLFFHMAGG